MAATNVPASPDEKVSGGSFKEPVHEVVDKNRAAHGDDDDGGHEEELHRALSARQISMIAIGGAVGTGLILGSGSALRQAGPAGLLISYCIMGSVCYGVLTALGEMTAYIPHKKGFPGHSSQFVDDAFGFAVGWNVSGCSPAHGF